MNRPLGFVQAQMSSDNLLYATYYQQVGSEGRSPQDNEWDRGRQSVDTLLLPYYYDHIHFGALSLDGAGIRDYGEVSLTFKDESINRRATVFEENSRLFVRQRKIVAGDPVPPGYRAPWSSRGDLAVAKLAPKLNKATIMDDFPRLLMQVSPGGQSDFIEVHIYGP